MFSHACWHFLSAEPLSVGSLPFKYLWAWKQKQGLVWKNWSWNIISSLLLGRTLERWRFDFFVASRKLKLFWENWKLKLGTSSSRSQSRGDSTLPLCIYGVSRSECVCISELSPTAMIICFLFLLPVTPPLRCIKRYRIGKSAVLYLDCLQGWHVLYRALLSFPYVHGAWPQTWLAGV